MKEKCDKCKGDLEPIIVTELDQGIKEHRICKRCKIVYKEKKQEKLGDIVDNSYVRKGSEEAKKLKKWGESEAGGSTYGPDYTTYMLTVKGQLMIYRALELQEKRIQRLEVMTKIKERG